MQLPNEMNYVWLAGFFDGEGSVGIYYRKPREHSPNGEYFLRCQITQNNEPCIRWIANLTGGNIHFQPKSDKPTTSFGEAYVVYWSHRRAEIFLKSIAPYCILKSDEIEIAFQFMNMKVSNGTHYSLPINYFAKLEELRNKLRSFKNTRNGERIT